MARQPRQNVLTAEVGDGFQHLAFEALHQFQRHIEEIARAARRIEHGGFAELVVESLDRVCRRVIAPARLLALGSR